MCVCVCVCVCVCDAQFFQIMLKLRGSTMLRPNHEFLCSVALSPGFTNWVEMTRNMQQEGVGLVLLPRPASLVPCFPARRPHWASLLCCRRTRGAKNPQCRCAVGGRGGRKTHGCRWSSCARRGWKGVGWRLVLCDLFVSAELMIIRKHWLAEGQRFPTLAFGRVPQRPCSRLLP